MNTETPRHLRREPKAVGRAVAWAIISLVAAWMSVEVVDGPALVLATLCTAGLGARGVFVNLGHEHVYKVAAGTVALALTVLPLIHNLSQDPPGDDQAAPERPTAPSTEETTTTARTPATTAETITPTTAGPTTTAAPPTAANRLKSLQDGRCLDDKRSGMQVSICGNDPSMSWELVDDQIKHPGTNWCISQLEEFADGGKVAVVACDSTDPGQKWTYVGRALRNDKGGCLDVSQQRYPTVQIWTCEVDDFEEQQWDLAGGGAAAFTSAGRGRR